jgi:hypothetical protein
MTTTVSADVQLTVAATGASPGSVVVEPNSTVEWVNDSHRYPNFEIAFVGPSPTSTDANLSGSVDAPVDIYVSGGPGMYYYVIEHQDCDGTTQKISGPFPFSVHQCGACP